MVLETKKKTSFIFFFKQKTHQIFYTYTLSLKMHPSFKLLVISPFRFIQYKPCYSQLYGSTCKCTPKGIKAGEQTNLHDPTALATKVF